MVNNGENARLIILVFLLLICSLSPVIAQDWVYTTVKGDSLWNLSEKHLDSVLRYSQLKKINGIKHPRRMLPGTQIRIPMQWIRSNSVPAQILSMQGNAVLYLADGSMQKGLAAGTLLHLGDRLKAGPDSSIAVKFADHSILTLYSNSVIRFDHLSAHGSTGMVDSRIHLLEGRLDTRVIPAQGPGSRFEIQTPSAISAVRGTEYRASVAEDLQFSNIEVLKGQVVVSGAKIKKLIDAGYGTQVAVGQPPLPARHLLAAPEFKAMDSTLRSIHSVLSWQTVPGAVKYRIEVAEEENFNTILWQQFSQFLSTALPDIADGHYFIRLRAIDERGLEGQSAVNSIIIDARPQAPLQLQPVHQFVLRAQVPQLQWSASSEADKYRLEIAAEPGFKQLLLVRTNLSSNRFVPSDLSAAGLYFWRLYSIAADGETGPVGTVRSYEIKPLPEKVDPQMNVADDGKLVASWRSGTPGQVYQAQLAYDDVFSDLVFERKLNKPQVSFSAVTGQIRYLRIRAIEADGYQGAWGATQRIDPLPDKSIWLIPGIGLLGLILL